ncbi:hypothetical protein B7494_g6275 [Chlorociboria aeruginascens]|nr:hypothetical protein B7494_g6275 [Chlorociboria aeruginascens]
MSIIQQVSNATLSDNWRTINIDLLDPESSSNFETSTLHPAFAPVSDAEIRQVAGQVRQLLRGGDAEGALRGALESAPYGGDGGVKELHLQTVTEVLQSIKASEMTPMLQRIFKSEGGSEVLDVLIKYLYKGMATTSSRAPSRGSNVTPQSTGAAFSQIGGGRPGAVNESSGAAMSVLLSWHEKVVEVAGLGCVGRCMTDWRKIWKYALLEPDAFLKAYETVTIKPPRGDMWLHNNISDIVFNIKPINPLTYLGYGRDTVMVMPERIGLRQPYNPEDYEIIRRSTRMSDSHAIASGHSVELAQPSKCAKLTTFTCFGDLPTELRLKIWKFALPRPRFVRLEIEKFSTGDGFGSHIWDGGKYLKPRFPVFNSCQEARQVAAAHYSKVKVRCDLPDKFSVGTKALDWSLAIVDFQHDTVFISFERLTSMFTDYGVYLDLAQVKHLASDTGKIFMSKGKSFFTLAMYSCPVLETLTILPQVGHLCLPKHSFLIDIDGVLEDVREADYNFQKPNPYLNSIIPYLSSRGQVVRQFFESYATCYPDYWQKVTVKSAVYTSKARAPSLEKRSRIKAKNEAIVMQSKWPQHRHYLDVHGPSGVLIHGIECDKDWNLVHRYEGLALLFQEKE